MVELRDHLIASVPVSTVERSLEVLRSWMTISNGTAAVVTKSQTVYAGGGNRYVTNTAPDGSYEVSTIFYGRLSSVTRKDAVNNQLSAISYSYDEHGRVKTVTDARNGTTTYSYNNADQRTAVTTPAPGTG